MGEKLGPVETVINVIVVVPIAAFAIFAMHQMWQGIKDKRKMRWDWDE